MVEKRRVREVAARACCEPATMRLPAPWPCVLACRRDKGAGPTLARRAQVHLPSTNATLHTRSCTFSHVHVHCRVHKQQMQISRAVGHVCRHRLAVGSGAGTAHSAAGPCASLAPNPGQSAPQQAAPPTSGPQADNHTALTMPDSCRGWASCQTATVHGERPRSEFPNHAGAGSVAALHSVRWCLSCEQAR